MRLLALLQFKNHAAFLPGYLENVAEQVDGIVALDDGASDGSAELVEAHPAVLEVLRASGDGWDDPGNRRRLTVAAWEHRPDWLIGVDADERLERRFRRRAERILRGTEADGLYVHWRELWDRPDRWRADGIWGQKKKSVLFRARRDHAFDMRALHGTWAPLNGLPPPADGRATFPFPVADLIVWHLSMIRPEDRVARRERLEAIDPDRRWQPIGYDYLTDEAGLRLRRVGSRRGYRPRPAE